MSIKKFRKELNKALDKNPASMVFVRLADTFRVEDKLEKAEEILLEGLNKNPGFFTANLAYAKVLLQMGRIEEAKDLFEEVVRVDSRCLSALNHLVQISMELGNAEQAELYNTQISDLDPYHSLDDGLSMFDLDDESTEPMEGGELVGDTVSPDAIAEGVDEIFGSDEERDSEFAASIDDDAADIGLDESEPTENNVSEDESEIEPTEDNDEVIDVGDDTPVNLDTSDQDELLEDPSPEEVQKEQLELKSIDSALESQGLISEEISLDETPEDPDFLKEMNQFKDAIVSGGIEMAGSVPDEASDVTEEESQSDVDTTVETIVDESIDPVSEESGALDSDNDSDQLEVLDSVLNSTGEASTESIEEDEISSEDMLDLDEVSDLNKLDTSSDDPIKEVLAVESDIVDEPNVEDSSEELVAEETVELEDSLTESLVDDSVVEELVPESSVESIESIEEPVELDEAETIDLATLSETPQEDIVVDESVVDSAALDIPQVELADELVVSDEITKDDSSEELVAEETVELEDSLAESLVD
ncbi:MAG: hypothetical protein OCC49_05400, partial [Fibrobacterales bacterium]